MKKISLAGLLLVLWAGLSAQSGEVKSGEAIYKETCVACHQADGLGMTMMIPPVVGTSYVLGDKTVLINVMLKGMSNQEVDGEKYHNVMPPFDYMTDAEIAAVLTYVRTGFGNNASKITAEEVRSVRTANNQPK